MGQKYTHIWALICSHTWCRWKLLLSVFRQKPPAVRGNWNSSWSWSMTKHVISALKEIFKTKTQLTRILKQRSSWSSSNSSWCCWTHYQFLLSFWGSLWMPVKHSWRRFGVLERPVCFILAIYSYCLYVYFSGSTQAHKLICNSCQKNLNKSLLIIKFL